MDLNNIVESRKPKHFDVADLEELTTRELLDVFTKVNHNKVTYISSVEGPKIITDCDPYDLWYPIGFGFDRGFFTNESIYSVNKQSVPMYNTEGKQLTDM